MIWNENDFPAVVMRIVLGVIVLGGVSSLVDIVLRLPRDRESGDPPLHENRNRGEEGNGDE